jgi:hypothetical protein
MGFEVVWWSNLTFNYSSSSKTMFDFETDILFLNMLLKHPELNAALFFELMHHWAGNKKATIGMSTDGDLGSFTF